ncbi:hypothetical protein BROUX41_004102 [Berkeleyomyces rouxiae]
MTDPFTAHSDRPDPSPEVKHDFKHHVSPSTLKVLRALIDTVMPGITVAEPHSDLHADSEKSRPKESKLLDDTITISPSHLAELYNAAKENRSSFPSPSEFSDFLAEQVASRDDIVDALRGCLEGVGPKKAKMLFFVVWLLSTRLGGLAFTGKFKGFHKQTLGRRQNIMKSWIHSRQAFKCQLAKATTLLAQKVYIQKSPLYPKIIDFSPIPKDYVKTQSYPFEFIQMPDLPDSQAPEVLHTDIVVVGSGPGGGVCAQTLSEAGYDVIVVDKGLYYPSQSFPMTQFEGEHHLFENHGSVTSESSSTNCVAGSCWGGGGTINWGVSLRTQSYVRNEWATGDDLPFYTSTEYDDCMDVVWDTIGASTDYPKDFRGKTLKEGACRIGYEAENLALNSGNNKEHYCGRCHLGCGSNSKQGPMTTWLPRAARNGARFVEGFQVQRVMFDEEGTTAVGVEGAWTSRESAAGTKHTRIVQIMARRAVVISAGSLWSPVILKKSGIKNPVIGKNLHLHPVGLVLGRFDREINPWEGPAMSTVVKSFENLDGAGHGVKIEPSCSVPYVGLIAFPWSPGITHRMDLLKYPTLAPYVIVTRDRDPGRITVDSTTGGPQVHYTPSKLDAKHTLEGMCATARILHAQGALEIFVGIPTASSFTRSAAPSDPAAPDPAFEAWLSGIRRIGTSGAGMPWLTAHQMGTCRMSGHAKRGVVDAQGRVYGREKLYVADASVLPSASGVNPMVSVMATALHIARGMVERLKAEDAGSPEN